MNAFSIENRIPSWRNDKWSKHMTVKIFGLCECTSNWALFRLHEKYLKKTLLHALADQSRAPGMRAPSGFQLFYFHAVYRKILDPSLKWLYFPFHESLLEISGGSRISPRRGSTPQRRGAPTYDFAKFSQKLHEIERIWTPRGHASLAPPLDPPLFKLSEKDKHHSL